MNRLIKWDIGTDYVSVLFIVLVIVGLWQKWFEISFNINIPIAISILGLGGLGSIKSIASSLIKAYKF